MLENKKGMQKTVQKPEVDKTDRRFVWCCKLTRT